MQLVGGPHIHRHHRAHVQVRRHLAAFFQIAPQRPGDSRQQHIVEGGVQRMGHVLNRAERQRLGPHRPLGHTTATLEHGGLIGREQQ